MSLTKLPLVVRNPVLITNPKTLEVSPNGLA
jgi:hypothetical protein